MSLCHPVLEKKKEVETFLNFIPDEIKAHTQKKKTL